MNIAIHVFFLIAQITLTEVFEDILNHDQMLESIAEEYRKENEGDKNSFMGILLAKKKQHVQQAVTLGAALK